MAKKKTARKAPVRLKPAPAPPKAPKPSPILSRGSFMQRAYGVQYRWEWDGSQMKMTASRKVPAVMFEMDFGPKMKRLRFSGGAAHPDPDGVFRFALNEPDMRGGWVFAPEGEDPEPLAVGLG